MLLLPLTGTISASVGSGRRTWLGRIMLVGLVGCERMYGTLAGAILAARVRRGRDKMRGCDRSKGGGSRET